MQTLETGILEIITGIVAGFIAKSDIHGISSFHVNSCTTIGIIYISTIPFKTHAPLIPPSLTVEAAVPP